MNNSCSSVVCPKWIISGPLHLKKYSSRYWTPSFTQSLEKLLICTPLILCQTLSMSYVFKSVKHSITTHYNAYVVSTLSLPSILRDISSLPSYPVLHAHKAFNKSEIYIVLKQYFM